MRRDLSKEILRTCLRGGFPIRPDTFDHTRGKKNEGVNPGKLSLKTTLVRVGGAAAPKEGGNRASILKKGRPLARGFPS